MEILKKSSMCVVRCSIPWGVKNLEEEGEEGEDEDTEDKDWDEEEW
jgi:hypothetical protein